MSIGQRINEFDNNFGTVGEFNRLFPNNPLDKPVNYSVEILGFSSGNCFRRFLEVNDQLIEHDFSLDMVDQREKEKYTLRKKSPVYSYTLTKKGKYLGKFKYVGEFIIYLNIDEHRLNVYFREKGDSILIDDCMIERKKLPKVKKAKTIIKYELIRPNGIKELFKNQREVSEAAGHKSWQRISKGLKKDGYYRDRKGNIIIKKEEVLWK